MKFAPNPLKFTFISTLFCTAITMHAAAQTGTRHEVPSPATGISVAAPAAAVIEAAPAAAIAPATPATPATASVKVGILTTHTVGGPEGTQALGEQVRSLLARDLSSPSIEPVLIFASTPNEIQAEAKQKNCAFLLESTLSEKKTGGLGMNKMMLLQGASMMIPMAGMVRGVGGMVSAQMAGAAMSQASTTGMYMHPHTAYTFDYRLTAIGSVAPALSNSETAKASREGDDVLSPVLLHAASAITAELQKK